MKSFIKYYGGKSQLSKEIIKMIPEHKTYVETFCGGSWLLFNKPYSNIEVINDIDSELINLYFVVKYQTKEFIKCLNEIIISEDLFNIFANKEKIKFEELNDRFLVQKGIPEMAMVTYYTIMNSFNGNIADKIQFSVSKDRNSAFLRLNNTNWEEIQKRLKEVTILNRDYKKVLELYDDKKTFFYLDPPYLVATGNKNYYRNTFSEADHKELKVYLEQLEGKFLLTYAGNKIIMEMYKEFNIIETKNNLNEVIITNYEIPENPYYSGTMGIPNTPGVCIPKKAPESIPNCPYCGSRLIQNVSKRITLENNRRNWKTCGFVCNDCKELFRYQIGIPNEDLAKVYRKDREGIPKGDER